MKNIYLIGFMATGKSTVGRLLARRLGREFVDLDRYIEEKAGKKIADIFALCGEGFFRSLEKRILSEVSGRGGIIVACGGGIVTDGDNIAVMKRTGTIVCLTASVEEILKRVKDPSSRPLLCAQDRKEKVETLLGKRREQYACADASIDTTGLSPDEVAAAAAGIVAEK
ncbi:MAG: shikimate kinase [Deltaproteobacteria bacterium]